MSAANEQAAVSALGLARKSRAQLEAAVFSERHHTVRFMRHALADGWSWERIGKALNISGTAARRYFGRNGG